jgi:hypothetical protein
MDELEIVFVGSNFDWVMQVLLIFLLYIDGNGMIMNEFD